MKMAFALRGPVYSDLKLEWNGESDKLYELIKTSLSLGYQRLAFNNSVDLKHKGGKGKKKEEKVEILPGSSVLLNEETVKILKAKNHNFEQLSRVTANMPDMSALTRIRDADFQSYDIIAVQPKDDKTFQIACDTLDVDIICVNLTENSGFLPRKLVKKAIERGIHFEVSYSPALVDSTAKRNIISNAMALIEMAGGKGVIVSSGANQALDLRSPYDVMNLGKLFGLSQSQSKEAVGMNPRAVLKHAETRKSCKSVVSVCKLSSLQPEERRIIESQVAQRSKMEDTVNGTSEDEDSNAESDFDQDDGPSVKKLKT